MSEKFLYTVPILHAPTESGSKVEGYVGDPRITAVRLRLHRGIEDLLGVLQTVHGASGLPSLNIYEDGYHTAGDLTRLIARLSDKEMLGRPNLSVIKELLELGGKLVVTEDKKIFMKRVGIVRRYERLAGDASKRLLAVQVRAELSQVLVESDAAIARRVAITLEEIGIAFIGVLHDPFPHLDKRHIPTGVPDIVLSHLRPADYAFISELCVFRDRICTLNL